MKYPFLDLARLNEPLLPELEAAALRVIRSGRYIGGEENEALDAELASFHHAPFAIGVSNGLDALRLIIRGYIELGIMKPGDEIIVPGNTYIASLLAVSDNGLTPVPVDPDIATMNLDAAKVEAAITPRTRAIMPVHLYGRVAWDESLRRVAMDHDLKVIEDCAQAIGAVSPADGIFSSRNAGALGHAGAISFYPTKNIGALGDAGAVITHDPDLAAAVKALANYGSDRRYHNIYRGLNCRLDPIQAAMLRVKLKHILEENTDRSINASIYDELITNPQVIKPMIPQQDSECVWHQYVIRVPSQQRDTFREQLKQQGVGTDVHYATPPHLQPCYASLPHGPLPVTEQLASEVVSLPITSATTPGDITAISEIINSIQL
ncbi:MAG: DegT/DnrJ/EryC1/StrS family aminotransferase [Duncaniella sp.]|nr:DegT/DnrJ/EryC1/StrS family aminotransferase [Duncaniella sp.]